jgi:hypothetical protein
VCRLGDPHTFNVSDEVLHIITLGVAYFKWNQS